MRKSLIALIIDSQRLINQRGLGTTLTPALLALEDGSLFHGMSIGIEGQSVGEVVFNTAMTGYQEILTDPSYANQIVTLTYPQIGNTGANPEDVESDQVWASGLVIRRLPKRASSWRMTMTLPEYLVAENVVAIAEIDTRRLTQLIREKGALAGALIGGDATEAQALAAARAFPGLQGMDLAKLVSRVDQADWQEAAWDLETGYGQRVDERFHVVAYDFGVKRNILRLLASRGCRITVVPAMTTAQEALALQPDGIFLSNGPGDPEPCGYAIAAIRTLLEAQDLPIFGICLGHQLLALASGAETMKMPHGHHGANHPVKDLRSDQVIITSQNHGFAVDGESLPNCLETTHVSLFDGTLQGTRRTDRMAFGFQGHPEASPGPQDCQYLFDEFVQMMAEVQS